MHDIFFIILVFEIELFRIFGVRSCWKSFLTWALLCLDGGHDTVVLMKRSMGLNAPISVMAPLKYIEKPESVFIGGLLGLCKQLESQ